MQKNQNISWGVEVTLVSCRLVKQTNSKPHVLYHFEFRIGETKHSVEERYSNFLKLHEELKSSGILDKAFRFYPISFPSKNIFKGMI